MRHLLILLFLMICLSANAQIRFEEAFDTVGVPILRNAQVGTCYILGYKPDIYKDTNEKIYEVYKKKATFISPKYDFQYKDTIIVAPNKWVRKPNLMLPKNIELIDPVIDYSLRVDSTKRTFSWIDCYFSQYDVKYWKPSYFCIGKMQKEPLIFYKAQEIMPPKKIIGKDTFSLNDTERLTYYELASEKTNYLAKATIKQKGKLIFKDTLAVFYAKTKLPTRLPKGAVLVEKSSIIDWKSISIPMCRMSSPLIIEIQHSLCIKGYYKGPVNNEFNRKTKKALRRFQKDNNLKVTGRPNEPTLKALGIGRFHHYPYSPLKDYEFDFYETE